jgi:hypothetical protein
MKKPARSITQEEHDDPMRDLDLELNSQDDEIIDLEDIIEMPDRPIDEDEDLDLDVEILDVDADFEQQQEPSMKQPARSGEKDLIEVFGDESEDEDALFDQITSKEPATKAADKVQPKVFEKDEASRLDDLLDEVGTLEPGPVDKKNANLKDRAAAAIKIPEEARPADIEPEPASAVSLEEERTSAPPAVDMSKTAEELMDRIESRLQEHIRALVEWSLPDLVRSIISEEIEKIKKELH